MAIGELTSSYGYSSLKYTGGVIGSRFSTTTVNQQLVNFLTSEGNTAFCNAVTIEAGASDLYFALMTSNMKTSASFTDAPVYFVPAGETMSVSGLSIKGIKFANNLGAQYYIQGIGY